MKIIGIVSNNEKLEAIKIAKKIYDHLNAKEIRILLLDGEKISQKYNFPSVPIARFEGESELIISVGGDGTFLRASRHSFKRSVPVLGINVGTLGFLTVVDPDTMLESIDRVLSGDFKIEERMLLEGDLYKDGKVIVDTGLQRLALNEFAITRSTLEKVIRLEIIVNDIPIKKMAADGIIIATPTGSTAYSLSAGGPVIEPKNEVIIITPICAHTLFSRSIIICPENELKIKIRTKNKKDIFNVDGLAKAISMYPEYLFKVKRSKLKLKLIYFKKDVFFRVFKEKFIERI